MTTSAPNPTPVPPPRRLRVLLVDDSPLVLLLLKRILGDAPDMEVVGVAANGAEALKMVERLLPDVVCSDLEMPVMDGLEFIQKMMILFPRPVLVVSSVVADRSSERVFALLQAGAVDVFPKPAGGFDPNSKESQELVQRVRIVAGVRIFPRRPATLPTSKPPDITAVGGGSAIPLSSASEPGGTFHPLLRPKIVAIGASTGGPLALNTVLSGLPADFPVPILCIQHIGAGFLPGMVAWLDSQSRLKIELAREREKPQPGHVYFAPEGAHLVLDALGRMQFLDSEPFEGHRPSVNVTFLSLADRFGAACAAVLLTGMGRDGAAGIQAIGEAEGWTIAQNEATCTVFGMPRAAIETGQVRQILPLENIAPILTEALMR